MKITIKNNINFNELQKEIEKEKLTKTLNKELSPPIVESSKKFIKDGNVMPRLSGFQRNYRKSIGINQNKPLFMTGKLANSLKASDKGIKGVKYAKDHRTGYTDSQYGDVPKREFITAVLPQEKSNTLKIYKEFQDKFVKLLSKALRKR
mgnify:FL=1|tara:strand:- start:1410 stop:1856 length:447 start_codon:yes stop_codon:yes gene_type:complete